MAFKDKDKKRAYDRKWHKEHGGYYRKINQEWGLQNPDKIKEYNKTSYAKQLRKTKRRKGIHLAKKTKGISFYISFDSDSSQQALWRQKIDENGELQGTGFFQISRVGKMTLEKRRESNRKWRPIMEAKRKGFGYVELNSPFEGSQGHHLDKEFVLHIPQELHQSIKHSVLTDLNMNLINDKAIEWAYGTG